MLIPYVQPTISAILNSLDAVLYPAYKAPSKRNLSLLSREQSQDGVNIITRFFVGVMPQYRH